MEVFVVTWTESERGWGRHPDGLSVHFSREQQDAYKQKVKNDLIAMYGQAVPDEYSFPEEYFKAIINANASPEILLKVLKEETIRTFEHNPKWLTRIRMQHEN